MDRQAKTGVLTSLKGLFATKETVIVAHYAGLNAEAMTDLRRQMREAGAGLRVTKNRLVRRALKGTPHEGIADLFEGPTAIAHADDPVIPAKVLTSFAKAHESLVILGGSYGERRIDAKEVKTFAAIPPLNELRATIASMLATPARQIATVAQAPASTLARVFGAYAQTQPNETTPS